MRFRNFRAKTLAGCALAPCLLAPALQAQSVAVDSAPRPRATPAPPSTASPAVAATPAPVVPPRALSTPIAYPAEGHGEQEVILELTIGPNGEVTSALAIGGAQPFANSAMSASRTWSFEPARRAERAITAKIRFSVRFVPPLLEPEAAPTVVAPLKKSVLPMPVLPAREILVIGQREPLKLTLGHAEVHDMPGAFGDPYRAIEALPGVVPIVSGLPYFYVRGAPPGNVGYFFDGISVPYLYHFAAGPGVLQPSFVDHVDLYPGAYPARYGRFAGAIVAGEMAPPSDRVRGDYSVWLIDSSASIAAPFASDRGSAMVGGRYSYTAAVLSLLVPKISLSYWDYQARVRYELGSKDSIELLSFGAGDFLSNTETIDRFSTGPDGQYDGGTFPVRHENTVVDVNFHRLDLRWDHRLPAGNWRTAVMLGRDRTGADDQKVEVKNNMLGLRGEYQQELSPRTTLRAGGDVLFESLAQQVEGQSDNGIVDTSSLGGGSAYADSPPDFGLDRARRDLSGGVWTDVSLVATPQLDVTPGLRADLFVSGGRVALALDPRISARFRLTKQLSVTHGLGLVHQAPSFVVPVPGFKPSLEGGLQSAVQESAGMSFSMPVGLDTSVTLFQNAFFNMTDLISLAQLRGTMGKTSSDFRATGHATGVELMIRRSLARNVGGFVSYTLSRSVRTKDTLEGPATSDRTHVLNVALSGNLGHDFRLSGRWLFYSGIPSKVAYAEAAKSPPRTPPYWRLDFKLQKRWYIKRPDVWWGLALEVLNTTLNKEALNGNCNAFSCKYDSIGPVTIPSIGAEGAF